MLKFAQGCHYQCLPLGRNLESICNHRHGRLLREQSCGKHLQVLSTDCSTCHSAFKNITIYLQEFI